MDRKSVETPKTVNQQNTVAGDALFELLDKECARFMYDLFDISDACSVATKSANVTYILPVKVEDELVIEFSEIVKKGASCKLNFSLLSNEGVAVEGSFMFVHIRRDTLKPVRFKDRD